MNISFPAPLPAPSRSWVTAVGCAAAIAAGGTALVALDTDDPFLPAAQPSSVVTPPGGVADDVSDDLGRSDGALLHHDGVRVPPPVEPTPAQRLAAERFNHR